MVPGHDTRAAGPATSACVTDRLNAPDGVNLMANTTLIVLGVLLAPVTLLFGAPVTFALLVALNLAGTALAWYLLFARTLGARRLAAAVGAAFCGFAPAWSRSPTATCT